MSKKSQQASTEQPAASYEHARDELAQVVAKLESGGLSLDDSLALWERGEHLARECAAFLDGARDRVEAALDRADDPDPDPDSDDDSDDDEDDDDLDEDDQVEASEDEDE